MLKAIFDALHLVLGLVGNISHRFLRLVGNRARRFLRLADHAPNRFLGTVGKRPNRLLSTVYDITRLLLHPAEGASGIALALPSTRVRIGVSAGSASVAWPIAIVWLALSIIPGLVIIAVVPPVWRALPIHEQPPQPNAN